MAVETISLFFRNNRTYSIGNIVLDLITNETHNFNNTVTQYTVEDGSVISDHIENQIFNGTISGIITNFSLFQDGLSINRAQDAFNQLKQLWRDKNLVTINTVLDVYDNVAITSIGINKGVGSGEEIAIDISFVQVNVAKLQEIEIVATVSLPNMDTSQNRQSSPNTNVGKTRPVIRQRGDTVIERGPTRVIAE